tara:strand:+ start:963 stop:2087 length:1125 start_codon:yes stop_codon:yes gene_type:complete
MNIVHIFAAYPNKYQPYNTEFINELNKIGYNNKVFSFSLNGGLDSKTTYLFNNPSKYKMIYNFIFDFYRLLKYKKYSEQTIGEALTNFTRYKPLLYYFNYFFHIHHIQIIDKKFLSFLKCFKIAYSVSIRGSDVAINVIQNPNFNQNLSLALSNTKSIHAVSNDLAMKLKSFTRNENIFIIPRYIVYDENRNISKKSNETTQILTVGRYHWVKGYNYILETLCRLKKDKIEFNYTICGDGSVEETKQLNYLVELYGLSNQVDLVGFVDHQVISSYYKSTDIYLCGSIYEGMPNAVINALNYNIPIVATSVGGIPEIITDGINGLLCLPADSQDMKKKLLQIINKDYFFEICSDSQISNSKNILSKYLDFYKNKI